MVSIDESFLDLTLVAPEHRGELRRDLRSTVSKWTGVPICVGIGPMKTLAKLANKIAKTTPQHWPARRGYPDWLHYVTAAFEFAVAILLLFRTGRSFGALLGMGVMAAAAGTTLFHREYKHAVLPLIILILLGILWCVTVRGS